MYGSRKFTFLYTRLILIALIIALPSLGESSTSSSAASSQQNNIDDLVQAQAMANQFLGQQDQQSQDRKKNSGDANVGAIIGAAVAGASCAMLLAMAKNEPDPAKKQQLLQQALQQCGQAAQSAAAAGDNKKANDAVAANNTPTGSNVAQPEAAPADPVDEPLPEVPIASQPEPTPEVVAPEEFQPPPASAFDPSYSVATTEPLTELDTIDDPAYTKLNPIEEATVTYDVSAKAGGTPVQTDLGSSSFFVSDSSRAVQSQNASQADKAVKRKAKAHNRNGAGGAGANGSSGSALASSSSDDGGSLNVSSMLNRYMNKGGSPAESGGSGGQIVNMKTKDKLAAGKRPPTIFEYTSFRYRRLKKDEVIIPDGRSNKRPKSLDGLSDNSAPDRSMVSISRDLIQDGLNRENSVTRGKPL